MRDSDIDALSADGAQDSDQIMKWDDPRAALADVLLGLEPSHEPDLPYWPNPEQVADALAERGALLVTEERLASAIARVMRPADAVNAAAIFAALRDPE